MRNILARFTVFHEGSVRRPGTVIRGAGVSIDVHTHIHTYIHAYLPRITSHVYWKLQVTHPLRFNIELQCENHSMLIHKLPTYEFSMLGVKTLYINVERIVDFHLGIKI